MAGSKAPRARAAGMTTTTSVTARGPWRGTATMRVASPGAAGHPKVAVMAAGSAIRKAIPKPRAADGTIPATVTAAGMAIRKAIPKPPAADGTIPATVTAAGMAIRKATPKPRAADGTTRVTARAAGIAILKAIQKRRAAAGNTATRATIGAVRPVMTMTIAVTRAGGVVRMTTMTAETAAGAAVTAAGRAILKAIRKRPAEGGNTGADVVENLIEDGQAKA